MSVLQSDAENPRIRELYARGISCYRDNSWNSLDPLCTSTLRDATRCLTQVSTAPLADELRAALGVAKREKLSASCDNIVTNEMSKFLDEKCVVTVNGETPKRFYKDAVENEVRRGWQTRLVNQMIAEGAISPIWGQNKTAMIMSESDWLMLKDQMYDEVNRTAPTAPGSNNEFYGTSGAGGAMHNYVNTECKPL